MAEQTPPPDLKSRMKASYDAIAPKYNEWTLAHSDKKLHYLAELVKRLPDSPSASVSVLEIGCGHGLPVTENLLSHLNYTVTGNDLSSGQLDLARKNLKAEPPSRLNLIEGDMLALDFAPATFDAIVGMYSIIHLPRTEQVAMLQKITTWLKPGGWLLANFGAAELAGAEVQNWLEEEKGWMYWSGWGTEGTLEKIKEAGLKVAVQDILEDEDEVKFLWILANKKTLET